MNFFRHVTGVKNSFPVIPALQSKADKKGDFR